MLKRKESKPKYDILIGVAFDRNTFKNPVYYVFSQDEVNQIGEIKLDWPKNVKKKIHLFLDETSYDNALLLRPEIITNYEKFIIKNSDLFFNRWEKINVVI